MVRKRTILVNHKSQKRIAILLPDLRIGGAERVKLLLAENFLKKGYAVDFVLMQERGELLDGLPDSSRVIDLRAARTRNAFLPLVRYIRKERPNAMIVAMWPLTIIGVLATRLSFRPVKLLLSDHNYLPSTPYGKGVSGLVMTITMRLLYPMADSVVAVSQGVKEAIVKLSGLRSVKINVIYNPIQLEHSPQARVDANIEAWWRQAELKLIAIGSLKAQKDFDTLIRSFSKVSDVKDAKLLILGEGPERQALEKLVVELGLEDSIMLAGFKSDPYPYLEVADLFVSSSRYEGFGNVIVEALACGTPVIATDCKAGPSEILDGGKYGVLVPVGDPEALSKAIIDGTCNAPDQQILTNRAKMFSVERAAENYLKLLITTN